MNIRTRYDIGEIVYFIYDNQIKKATIIEIKYEVSFQTLPTLDYCIKYNMKKKEIKYKIYFETKNLTGDKVMHDLVVTSDDLYKTKKYAAMRFLNKNGLDIGLENLKCWIGRPMINYNENDLYRYESWKKILDHYELNEVSDQEVWEIARQYDDANEVDFANILLDKTANIIIDKLEKLYPNNKFDYFINDIDSHLYMNNEEIYSVDDIERIANQN